MKKIFYGILGLSIITAGLFNFGMKQEAAAELNIQLNLGPPVIMSDEPPEVVYVESSGIYFVPDPEVEIFFYRGFWWSHRGNDWYRSRNYRNGWKMARNREVPSQVSRVPSDYRQRFGNERRFRYQDWKSNKYRPLKVEKNNRNNMNRGGNGNGQGNRGGGNRN